MTGQSRRLFLFISFFIFWSTSALATDIFGADLISKSKGDFGDHAVLKSTTGKCWGKGSGTYQRVKAVFADDGNGNSIVSNGYEDFDACLQDGGLVTDSEQARAIVANEMSKEEADQGDASRKFAGFNWGIGLAYTSVDNELIQDVTISDSTVQVQSSGKQRALVLAEYHYWLYRGSMWHNEIGIGPYIAVGLVGEEGVEPLSTFGVGVMLGAKDQDGGSFNVGAGFFLDTGGKVFREGIQDGSSTEATDPDSLLQTVDSDGWMLLFSASF